MIIQDGEVGLAYTYAWWLTGDEERARDAVLAAVARPEVPGADDELRVEILLRRVRAAAVEQPTMCPASELALLHDGIGLPLDSAAGLAMIDSREARTELAHGRLEALGGSDDVEIIEPERLGGLAVGNPADVAAARQNPKLAVLRDMIMRGRDELVTLSPVEPPQDLLDRVAAMRTDELTGGSAHAVAPEADGSAGVADDDRTDDDQPDDDQAEADLTDDDQADDDQAHEPSDADAAPAAADPPGDVDESRDLLDAPVEAVTGKLRVERTEEVDLSDSVGDVEMPLGRPGGSSGNIIWLVLGVAFIAMLVFLLTSRGEDALPGGDSPDDTPTLAVPTDDVTTDPTVDPSPSAPAATDAPTTDDPTTDAPTAEPTDDAPITTPTSDPTETETEPAGEALRITETGVAVGLGADPDGDNPTATPFDPVSFELSYTGAVEGDALIAEWTVDGAPFALEQVDLLPGDSTSRFSRQVPLDGGWPIGQHVLTFTKVGQPEVLAEVRFMVSEQA